MEHSHTITKIIKRARPLDTTAKGYSQCGEVYDKSRAGVECNRAFRESRANTVDE